MTAINGINRNTRLIVPQTTVTFGTPLVYTADDQDNARLDNLNVALFYGQVENLVGGPAAVNFTIRNRVIGLTHTIDCITGQIGASEGNIDAVAVGFSMTNKGDYLSALASKARLAAGYQIEIDLTSSGSLDITIEVHYGKEAGG